MFQNLLNGGKKKWDLSQMKFAEATKDQFFPYAFAFLRFIRKEMLSVYERISYAQKKSKKYF